MKASIRVAMVAVLATMLVTVSAACTRVSGTPEPDSRVPSCSELLTAAVSYGRSGSGDIDAIMEALMDRCSDEYEIATDYLMNARESEFSSPSCEELLAFDMRSESVALLEQDGWCTDDASVLPAASPAWPEDGLGWDDARGHAGTVQRVCGPLMSMRQTEHGTFVNLGRDYPSAERFTIIFWDVYLDPAPADSVICGVGEVYLYEGVAQMEMWDPSSLEIWR